MTRAASSTRAEAFAVRTVTTLRRVGVTTLEQAVAMSDDDLLAIRQFGVRMLDIVREDSEALTRAYDRIKARGRLRVFGPIALTDRHRLALELRIEGLTFEQMGERLGGVSRERARQIWGVAWQRMRRLHAIRRLEPASLTEADARDLDRYWPHLAAWAGLTEAPS
jgi:DNA-directed RNA polymerase sigma subunit (sigma70/sigma32)